MKYPIHSNENQIKDLVHPPSYKKRHKAELEDELTEMKIKVLAKVYELLESLTTKRKK